MRKFFVAAIGTGDQIGAFERVMRAALAAA
jgi:hypothetical protein